MGSDLRAAAILFLYVCSELGHAQSRDTRFKLATGAGNPVCQSALKVVSGIPRSDFIANFNWVDRFEKRSEWSSAETSFVRSDGEKVPFKFSYVQFDLDNDASPDLVVATTMMMNSVLVDTWYMYRPSQLPSLLAEGVSESKLSLVPKIDAQFVPGFVPVEFARWSFEGINYVVLREFGFLRNRRPPASFLVAKYDGVTKGHHQESISKMTVVCDIRG
jgi:hypothetical protein